MSIYLLPVKSALGNRAELTAFHTDAAAQALAGVDHMGLAHLAGDAAGGAVTGTQSTALTLVGIDLIGEQRLALTGGAAMLVDVSPYS